MRSIYFTSSETKNLVFREEEEATRDQTARAAASVVQWEENNNNTQNCNSLAAVCESQTRESRERMKHGIFMNEFHRGPETVLLLLLWNRKNIFNAAPMLSQHNSVCFVFFPTLVERVASRLLPDDLRFSEFSLRYAALFFVANHITWETDPSIDNRNDPQKKKSSSRALNVWREISRKYFLVYISLASKQHSRPSLSRTTYFSPLRRRKEREREFRIFFSVSHIITSSSSQSLRRDYSQKKREREEKKQERKNMCAMHREGCWGGETS